MALDLDKFETIIDEKVLEERKAEISFPDDKKNDFDLEKVLHHFKLCLKDDKTLVLKDYLSAYHELCRFFRLTGKLFGFVAKDLETKMKAVEYQQAKHGQPYETVQSMIAFEVNNGKTHKKGHHPSGTRMFLRLHYALEFILLFMSRITEGDDDEKMSKLAWEVYTKTLYNHHPWLTRKLAYVAVYALPSKKHLIDVMCKHSYTKVMDLLHEVVDAGQPIYDGCAEVYKSHGLEHIP